MPLLRKPWFLAVVSVWVIASCGGENLDPTTSGPAVTATTSLPSTTTSDAAPTTTYQSRPWTEEPIRFTSDGNELFGVLTLPSGPGPHPAIVIVHGSGQDGVASRSYTDHARTWAGSGYAALRYDPPGVGESAGTSSYQSLEMRTDEVEAAVRFLQSRPDIASDRVGLWGESQGGWVIAMAAADYPQDVAFIVSVSGSGVSVAEQQIYNVEAESRAAGLSEEDIAKAVLFSRLLIDWQLVEPRYRQANEDASGVLGSGPWEAFTSLVYEPGDLTSAENLQAGIALLASIQNEPWAEFLRLRQLYIPALQSIPPEQAAMLKLVTGPDLTRNPGDAMTRVRCPVLAFFGEDDLVQPTEQSAALYARYLTEAGNLNIEIVVIPGVGHNIDLSIAAYAEAMTDWLDGLFVG
jgi:pimeloyl-ACP methyl ester carboxylesterase